MTQDNTQPIKSRRFWKVVLVLSLGVNLAVVGMVAGALWNGLPARHSGEMRALSALGLRPYVRALSDPQRDQLKARLDAQGAENTPSRKAFRAHLNELADALSAVPYDASKVNQVLETHRASTENRLMLGRTLLLAQIEAMTAQERADFAAALVKPRGKSGRTRRRN